MTRSKAKDERRLAKSGRGLVSQRTNNALAHKRSKGEKLGGDVPFGYQAKGNHLIPDAREQEVIGLMRQLQGEGLSLRKIAARLNDIGHRQKRGGRWSHVAVDRTLKGDNRRPPVHHEPETASAGAGSPVPSQASAPAESLGSPLTPSTTMAESSDVGAVVRAVDPSDVAVVTQTPENRLGTLERIVSNSQPGAGEAARRAAQIARLATGGEMSVRANVQDSDLTLWFGDDIGTAAAQAVLGACDELGHPWVRVLSGFTRPQDIAKRFRADGIKILHVAGERESRAPGIGAKAEQFLADVFRWLG
jgi:Circularly permutated YpsA SLOG family/Recombinase